MNLSSTVSVAAFILVSALLATSTVAQEVSPSKSYDDALARYRTCMNRLPMTHQTEGRERLAGTRKPEALQILCGDYQKPKSYPEYTRYTLAALLGQNFSNNESVATLDALRKANSKPVDTWLWVNVLRIQTDRVDDTEAVATATTSKNITHRAAAILALGLARNGNLKTAIVSNCIEWPKKDAERCVLLGAMSSALYENRRRIKDEDYRAALTSYIGLLDDASGLTHTSKIQIARHLQQILGGPALFVNMEPWLELLAQGSSKPKSTQQTTVAPRFFGIETEGERFCYVLDMSDSMCKDIAPSARPAGPLTGPKQKKPKGVLPDESDLPWFKIKTRWDLAREQMRISLQRLPPEKYFSIVWFGTDAGTLTSSKGMIRATKGNVDKVLAELDSIQVGERNAATAPDGTLRGRTNLHFGLRLAFSLSDKGFVEEAAYVDPAVLTHGCDTIFLLSDGAPSWDEFGCEDTNYGEGQTVVDTEYNQPAPPQARTTYYGPFHQDQWLIEDVKRMNAFRRLRLHCIGLGEANMTLLENLAQIGHGEVMSVGRQVAAQRTGGK